MNHSFNWVRAKKTAIAFSFDLVAIVLSWYFAYWLRGNLGELGHGAILSAALWLPLICAVQIISNLTFGLYRGIWRFASIPDLLRIIKAVFAASAVMVLLVYFLKNMPMVPRSIIPLYAIVLLFVLCGGRLYLRWYKSRYKSDHPVKSVLVIGAGQAGEGLVRDMLRDVHKTYLPKAILDDDTAKKGYEIHGVRVIGTTEKLAKAISKYNIELVMIALPSADSVTMRRLVSACEQAKIPFRTLPGLQDLAAGKVSINALRDVSIEDLLGRESIVLDWQSVGAGLKNKVVLVSGGGGSIGSELCRQVANQHPKQLVVIENSEFNLYSLEMEFKNKFPQLLLIPCLVDVTDVKAVEEIFQTYQPEIIFHAAAYKHVPMLEPQIRIAIKNNIIGTWQMAKAAVKYKASHFTLISTDKAVNPANVMGATKRAAEIICQNYSAQSATEFVTVRFGNVLGSAGSVVPLFKKQIAAGGPITVTHPDITRFFMTIPEASQLILQATMMGQGGEIFVLDMGEPIKITYLAEQMILLAGLQPHQDIAISFTGLRPGEKLYEELFHETEQLKSTKHPKIMLSQARGWEWSKLMDIMNEMQQACDENQPEKLQQLLKTLVPEWENKEETVAVV